MTTVSLKDQRTMTGGRRLETVAAVEAAWRKFARQGFEERDGERTLLDLTETMPPLPARVNAGRWIADCLFCSGGIAAWSENPRGCCLSCGRVYLIVFPADVEQIETVLMARPATSTRNYDPLTETLDDLKRENAEHLARLDERIADLARLGPRRDFSTVRAD